MKNNLSKLSNTDLIIELRQLVAQERVVLTRVLWHLKEVDFRKLFADAGYPSLFEYVVKELGYSESAAFRRISAMRLLKSLPASEVKEVEVAIQSGALNLSKLTLAQQHFKHSHQKGEAIHANEKNKILSDLQSKSTRECERYFAQLAPEVQPQEKIRPLNDTHSEMKIVVSHELLKKIEKLKNLQSHVNHDANLVEVLEMALDFALQKKDPQQKLAGKSGASSPSKPSASLNPRLIPEKIRQFVWNRDGGKCTYQSQSTQKKCGSRYQLQIDHIHPLALHGDADPKNLRLLCRTHNLRSSKKIFGSKFG